MEPWSPPVRLRRLTVPAEASFSPTISMYGIFFSWASRILAPIDVVGGAALLQRLLESGVGGVPHRISSNTLFGTGRQVDLDVREAEDVVDLLDEVQFALDLRLDLFLSDEEVRVVLRERADAGESVRDARSLVTMQSREVRQPDRQIAIGVALHRVDLNVSGTVHRLQR